MYLESTEGMDRKKPTESYNSAMRVVNYQVIYRPLVYGISHHSPLEEPYHIPGIELFFKPKTKERNK